MDYYNRQRPHAFNDGISPVAAEENLKHCPGLVDHYMWMPAYQEINLALKVPALKIRGYFVQVRWIYIIEIAKIAF